jgi:hypothetical protein
MKTRTSPLTNVLVGTLSRSADQTHLRASFEAEGGDPSNLQLLTHADDLHDQLLATGGGGSIGRLCRRLALAMDDTADSRLDWIRRDLSRGRCVMVLHGVERAEVAPMAARMRTLGAGRLRYSGRWTSTEHGTAVGAELAPPESSLTVETV